MVNAKNSDEMIGAKEELQSPIKNEDDEDICELEHLRKLFIGGLAPYTTEENLKNFYSQWGNVVDVVVMRDPVSKRSRGFGFITYTKSSMVDKAQDNRPHVIDGKTVEAKRALPRPERESRETNISVKKLFVGGLKDNHDENCLQEYFSQFGNVISIKILTDKTTGKRRGFAFIEYDDYDAVDKAILQKTHSIKYVVVDVKKSIYNQEQQKHAANNANNVQQPKQSEGPPNNNYRPPVTQAPYQPPPPPMNTAPPNYYWGPPPPMPQQYGGYQQPHAPQMNSWNYPPAQSGWNTGPPPSGPPPNWYANQWGGPPPSGPPPPVPTGTAPPPAVNWNVPPVPAPPVPPPNAPNNVPTQQQQPPTNFGSGYQQNYGGGPTKHNNMNTNRMNPYAQPVNYGNMQQTAPSGYNGYSAPATNKVSVSGPVNNGPGPVPKPITNGATVAAGANKYRR